MIHGANIQQGREARGLSVEELASKLGVDPADVEAWESDRAKPAYSFDGGGTFKRLQLALDFPAGFFTKTPSPPLGPTSLDWHTTTYLCDACDEPIDYAAHVSAGNDVDYHAWCVPEPAPAFRRALRDRKKSSGGRHG